MDTMVRDLDWCEWKASSGGRRPASGVRDGNGANVRFACGKKT